MFSVFIVDDEDLIREGLKTIIEWGKYGFTVCGEAVDGIEALDKIRILRPNLVLVDVVMPRMDGLQLIKQINEEKINCKTIVISGYSEFEYAQKALNYGARAYILKPINEDELAEMVKFVYSEISERIGKDNYKWASGEIIDINDVIGELLSGYANCNQIEECLNKYGYNLPWNKYQLILMNVDGFTVSERIGGEKILRNWVQMGWEGIVFSLGDYIGVIMKDLIFDDANTTGLDMLYDMMLNNVGKSVLIAVGEPEVTLEGIPRSFECLKQVCDNMFLYDNSMKYVFFNQNKVSKSSYIEINTEKIVEELIVSINSNDNQKIETLLQELNRSFVSLQLPEKRIKSEYIKLYLSLVNKTCYENLEQSLLNIEEVIDNINEMRSLKELYEFLRNKVLLMAKILMDSKPQSTINKIVDFVKKNYSNKEISIKMLASMYGYNPTYLGVLFKKYTGMSFKNYLEKLRVENAKQFLKKGLEAKEVADIVGYSDYVYFYKKFRKITGKSPIHFKPKASK